MNRKASPYYLNGEKFVVMADIPVAQLDRFSQWRSHTSTRPPRFQGMELARYEDYEYWFELHYLAEKDIDHLL